MHRKASFFKTLGAQLMEAIDKKSGEIAQFFKVFKDQGIVYTSSWSICQTQAPQT